MTTDARPAHEVRAFSIADVRLEHRESGDGGALRLSGYAAVFDRVADIGGMFDEVIRRGAFSRAIEERQDVALLFNHDPNTVMARTSNGSLLLREADTGLWFEAELDPRDPDAQRVVAKVERGNVSQGSFAFDVRTEQWTQDRPRPLRELIDLNLYDVSPVTYPAYSDTEVYARGRVVAPPASPDRTAEAVALGQKLRQMRRRLDLEARR